jgi:hypothetical protein
MRTHRWLKALAFGCCLGAGADAAFAQAPFMGGGGGAWVNADGSPAGAPPYAPQMQGGFQPAYPTNDPGVLYPPGTPSSFAPYPTISPYGMGNYSYDATYNKRGLWFREILNKHRDYYFNVNALATTTRGPGHATIGAETIKINQLYQGPNGSVPPNYDEGAYAGGTTGTGTGTTTVFFPPSRVFVDDGVNPYVYVRGSATATPDIASPDINAFPIRSTRIFNEFNSPGIQLEWGFEEEDGSGLRVDAWWGFSSDQTFQRGRDSINGVVIDQQLIIDTDLQFLFSRNGAVSWDTGIPDTIDSINGIGQTGIYGATVGTQKYDVMYRVNVQSQAGGGDVQMYMPDLMPSTSGIRLRPVYGAKYTFIGETFDFRGIDSGLSYTIGTTTGGTGGGTGGTTGNTFRPTAGPPDAIDSDLFETQVHSRVRSQLAGPMAGLRYDFGRNRNFKIWGQSSAGLMANYEQVRLNGFNAGENLVTRFLLGTNMLDGDSHFSDSSNHAHVSPVFEQTFMSESRILAALPLVREVPILANANFRLGYTSTWIGNVARPADSIEWNGFPKTPKVKIDYQTWSMGRVNVGLEWTY